MGEYRLLDLVVSLILACYYITQPKRSHFLVKIIWLIQWPFSLLRWLTIPSFYHVSIFTCAMMVQSVDLKCSLGWSLECVALPTDLFLSATNLPSPVDSSEGLEGV